MPNFLSMVPLLAFLLWTFHLFAAPNISNSEKWKALESESTERANWIQKQNQIIDDFLKKSANAKYISNAFQTHLDKKEILSSTSLPDGSVVEVEKLGLGKDTVISLRKPDQKSEILLKLSSFDPELRYSLGSVRMSPGKSLLIFSFVFGGSTDRNRIRFYDLEKRKLRSEEFEVSSFEMIDDKTIIFATEVITKDKIDSCVQFDFSSQSRLSRKCPDYFVQIRPVVFDISPISIKTGQTQLNIQQSSPQLFNLSMTDLSTQTTQTIFKNKQGYISRGGFLLDSSYYLILETINGQVVEVFDRNNKLMTSIATPAGWSINSLYKKSPSEFLCSFSTYLVDSGQAIYSVDLKKFVSASVWSQETQSALPSTENLSELMSWNGQQFVAENLIAVSEDGTQIPYVVISKNGMNRNGKNPTLFSVYGGMASHDEDYIRRLDVNLIKFISDGGVFVGAGLRGSSKFGQLWYDLGRKLHKKNTFADVAAVAKALFQEKITNPSHLILTGHSNGGLTAAATGLLYPGLFGQVIAVNGIYDLLAKDRLDLNYGGYPNDFGSNDDPQFQEYLATYSPVELAKTGLINNFFILTGATDSRVSPVHAYKFIASLGDAPNPLGKRFYSLTIENTGHLVLQSGNGLGNLKAQVAYWTWIYDTLGLTYK